MTVSHANASSPPPFSLKSLPPAPHTGEPSDGQWFLFPPATVKKDADLLDAVVVLNGHSPPPPPEKFNADRQNQPSSMSSLPDGRPNKTNPLTNLMETERIYIDQLGGIVRTVASAWTRRHKPPPELDQMFRRVEAIFKVNHAFLGKLKKDIGANPSNLRILGDVLLQWVRDMQDPYSAYCSQYVTGFDLWAPAQMNPRLGPALIALSDAIQAPQNPTSPNDRPGQSLWSLDALFLLPRDRLRYYRKLYSRLLKNADSSNDQMLRTAVGALDALMQSADARLSVSLSSQVSPDQVQLGSNAIEDVAVDTRSQNIAEKNIEPSAVHHLGGRAPVERTGTPGQIQLGLDPVHEIVVDTRNQIDAGRNMGRNVVSHLEDKTLLERPGASPHSNESLNPVSARSELSQRILSSTADVERSVITSQCLDIFTMKPRQVSLALNPPTLPFTRQVRFSSDVNILFTPSSTNSEIIHDRGHIFLLTDLLLICERMLPHDRDQNGVDGASLSLLYPPLAARHLRVAAVQETIIEVTVLRKEVLRFHAGTITRREVILKEFHSCISAAQTLPTAAKQLPPPVPQMPTTVSNNDMSRFSPPPIVPEKSIPPRTPSPADTAQRLPHLPPPSRGLSLDGSATRPIEETRLGSTGQIPAFGSRQSQDSSFRSGPSSSFTVGQIVPSARDDSVRMPPSHLPPGAAAPLRPPFDGMGRPSIPPRQTSLPPREDSMRAMLPNRNGTLPHPPSLPDFRHQPQPGMNMRPSVQSPGFTSPQPRPILPSATISSHLFSSVPSSPTSEISPPNSPVESETRPLGPVTSSVAATMTCKLFAKQHHSQWKSLGSAKLTLYVQQPTNIKQLVVEADNKEKTVLISTVVLSDGVERVGKTGVAIELSDQGSRTGVIYMIQLRNERSAEGLFNSLLAGSDRITVQHR